MTASSSKYSTHQAYVLSAFIWSYRNRLSKKTASQSSSGRLSFPEWRSTPSSNSNPRSPDHCEALHQTDPTKRTSPQSSLPAVAGSTTETAGEIAISRGNTMMMPLKSESNSALVRIVFMRGTITWVNCQITIRYCQYWSFSVARHKSSPWHHSINCQQSQSNKQYHRLRPT